MKCPKCQHENPEGAKFCNECAHDLGLETRRAGKDLSLEQKLDKIKRYLPKGLSEKILSERHKIEGERKQVTVMFCDMEGFTPLVDKLGLEKAYSLMDQIYEILIHNVHDHEGTVNEFTGDGIMALFGAPIALEDAPHRALRSALSIHRGVSEFSEEQETPLKMRIGINTGPVVLGSLGNDLRVEFKAVGDTVNLASRMEGLAEPGTTYVTKGTFQITEGLFHFEEIGEKKIKGKKQAVSVYRLLSVKEDVYRPRLGSERMIYSEMVGRDRELDKLEFQVMKAINGEGSIVNIVGEAGIGKSRLVAELRNKEVMKRVTLLEGRAISIGRNLAFHPIIDILKQWARIREDDSEAKAFEKLETAVRNVCPEDFYEVLPFVATLMGMKLSGRHAERVKGIEGEALEKLILKNVRDLLIKATELSPLIIVAEDLHWADTSSLELLESLFRLVEAQRILFVNVFRPGHKETGDRIANTSKEEFPEYSIEIFLQPLEERISEALVHNMLKTKGLHHPVIDQIVQRADGNPFFIEEVVRSFVDEGAVVIKDGAFEVTEKIDTMIVPRTINDVLMARIDRLEEKTRDLIKVASVIGRNFFYRILADVAKTIEDIDKRLEYLKEIQLIRERRRMEELEYLFKHALAQESAYESILLQKRIGLHRNVAASIEKIFRDRLHEFYGMLTYHYSRGEDEERAEEYLIKAGEQALKSSASTEALGYYQQALDLYLKKQGDVADPEKVAMLENNIAVSLYNKGRYAEAIQYFDRSLAESGLILPKDSLFNTLKFLGSMLHLFISFYLVLPKFGKLPTNKEIDAITSACKRAEALGYIDTKRSFIECVHSTSWILEFDLSKMRGGFGILAAVGQVFAMAGISYGFSRRVLDASRKHTKIEDSMSVLRNETGALIYHMVAGDWDNIDEYDDELIKQNLSLGERFCPCVYIYWHGFLLVERGYHDAAQKMVQKLSDISDVYEDGMARGMKYGLNTRLLIKSRKLHDYAQQSEQCIDFRKKLGATWLTVEDYAYKAQSQTFLNDIRGAEDTLEYVWEDLSGNKEVFPCFQSFLLLSDFTFQISKLEKSKDRDRASEASKNGRKPMESGKALMKKCRKFAFDRTEAYKLMGTCHWLVGKQKRALKWWNKSIAEGEAIGARLELSRTYFEIGKRLLEPNSPYNDLGGMKAEDFLEKAGIMFKEMDLKWDLDKLDRIAAYR